MRIAIISRLAVVITLFDETLRALGLDPIGVVTTEGPPGYVAQVIQAGYMIGERVLRPALVAVSKGGGKAASAASE